MSRAHGCIVMQDPREEICFYPSETRAVYVCVNTVLCVHNILLFQNKILQKNCVSEIVHNDPNSKVIFSVRANKYHTYNVLRNGPANIWLFVLLVLSSSSQTVSATASAKQNWMLANSKQSTSTLSQQCCWAYIMFLRYDHSSRLLSSWNWMLKSRLSGWSGAQAKYVTMKFCVSLSRI